MKLRTLWEGHNGAAVQTDDDLPETVTTRYRGVTASGRASWFPTESEASMYAMCNR
jgi:hypothetical protein